MLNTRYELNAEEISTVVSMLLHHKHLTMQDADLVACALDQFKKRPRLGFSDCLILELARKARHLPLGTLDRDIARLDGVERL